MQLVHLVLPDCLLLILGWCLRNKLNFTPEFFSGLEKLVYYFLFPALLIKSLMAAPISLAKAGHLFIVCLALSLIGWGLSYAIRWFQTPPALSLNSSSQCAYRFNTYIGLSLAPAVAGADSVSIMAVLVGFTVPIVNIIAVNSMAKQQGNHPFKEILKNPLVISTIVGLFLNFVGIDFPEFVDNTLDKLSRSTIPLGLMCVGAALVLRNGTQQGVLLSWMLTVRLMIMPIVAIILGLVFMLPTTTAQTLVLFAALPTASAAYILAVRMGGDARLVAAIISLSTVIAMVTIPLWLYIARLMFNTPSP
ncbi:AEC family transporter [Pelistega suis]|uniref:AEC family transporter n=1 Tax=Pelistega suis TaxID=1631957 RepID=UPI00211BA7C6|nr:AEC family transporter [Pelistega suis]MCQ9329034.1 AEC family transporter [Pelistega suis]